MTLAVAEKDNPVVLIVDDQPGGLKAYSDIFSDKFYTIVAPTKAAAFREIMSSPAIDLVFTDVNLEEGTPDQSGVDLAVEVRKYRRDLPIVGYSARFEKGELDQAYKRVFDDTMAKSEFRPQKINENIARYHELALEYRDKRTKQAERELERIKTKYEIRDKDIAVLRDLFPGRGFSNELDESGEETVDSLLRRLGYGLKIIGPGESNQTVDGSVRLIRSPIPFWVRKEKDCYVAELYGHPSVFAPGDSEDAAVSEALMFMDGSFVDYCETPPTTESAPETVKLWEFLQRVFAGDDDAAKD